MLLGLRGRCLGCVGVEAQHGLGWRTDNSQNTLGPYARPMVVKNTARQTAFKSPDPLASSRTRPSARRPGPSEGSCGVGLGTSGEQLSSGFGLAPDSSPSDLKQRQRPGLSTLRCRLWCECRLRSAQGLRGGGCLSSGAWGPVCRPRAMQSFPGPEHKSTRYPANLLVNR